MKPVISEIPNKNDANTILKLFHVGFYIIEDPDIHYGKKNADFGQGFYLSNDEEFSHRWAEIRPQQSTYLNSYELDLANLRVKRFERNEEWFRYIFDNRRGKEDAFADYDVIIGPIANDTIYDVLGITTSGYLSDEEALPLLQVGPTYCQVAIKTMRAKAQLKWLGYEQLKEEDLSAYKEIVEAEQNEFQQLFFERLSQIVDDES